MGRVDRTAAKCTYQTAPTLRDGYLKHNEAAPYIVLAFLTANDSIQPTEPPSGGLATQRHEYARIPHRDKTIVGRYLPDLDPDPDKANLCCNQAFTGRIIPDKLILRSGWNPGNFFVLVELAPHHLPRQRRRHRRIGAPVASNAQIAMNTPPPPTCWSASRPSRGGGCKWWIGPRKTRARKCVRRRSATPGRGHPPRGRDCTPPRSIILTRPERRRRSRPITATN